MALSDVVQVQVNINQSTIAQQGFGTPLIFAVMPGADRVLTFNAASWQSGMVAAGFNVQSAAYRCALAMMAQNPRPTTFKVGKRTTAPAQTVRVSPKAAVTNATAYAITIETPAGGTQTGTFVSDASATLAEVVTGLGAVVTAFAAGLTVDTSSGTYLQITAPADRIFSYVLSSNLKLEDYTAVQSLAADMTADLDAIRDADNDWYALCLPSSSPEAIEVCADWVEPNKKLFIASTHDYRPLTSSTTDIVSSIDAQNYARTHVAYNSRAGTFYGAAWTAALLPYEPGQADWKFKLLKGVIADKLTAQEETYLLAKGGSYYEKLVGREMTGAAKGGDGVFIDLTQLADWLSARVTEGIVQMLTASPKVPYTDQGGGNAIWGVLKNVIERGIQNGAIDEDPTTWSVQVPKRSEIAPADRAARRWPGCVMNVTPTGAVHSAGLITINFNVAG